MSDNQGKITGAICGVIWAAFFLWLGLWRCNLPFTFAAFGPFLYYSILVIGAPITMFLAGVTYDKDDLFLLPFLPTVVLVVALIAGGLSSSPMFNATRYATQLSVPEGTSFKETDVPAFDPTKIPWVDEAYANVLGDKPIGSLGAAGSSMEDGEYIRQEVNGELYFVSPLLHTDYFKYRKMPGGTPGFIMVNMTNADDVKLVTKDSKGKEIKIKIQPEGHAAFGDKLQRIVQRVAPGALRYQYKFEVDNDLHPYWVVSIYQCKIGWWGGKDITKVVIVDATTGDAKVYAVNEVPDWVDRIYPTELIENQLSNWGKYSGGWWNSFIGKTGLLQSDEGDSIVYRDSDCYVFDSLTSTGKDESTVGFVLVDLRTKEVKRFSLAGATEYSAQQSAVGDNEVKAQGYKATFPLPTLIEGQPTYFMVLTDADSSIAKAFAFVNIEKYQIVGTGTTIRAAEIDYRTELHKTNQGATYSPGDIILDITGKIIVWGQYVVGGNSFYDFIVSGYEDRIFNITSATPEASISKVGDRVKLQVNKTDNSNWSIFTFDNLEYTQTKGAVEQTVTDAELKQKQAEVAENPNIMNDEKFKDFWNSLTPEQQAAFTAKN